MDIIQTICAIIGTLATFIGFLSIIGKYYLNKVKLKKKFKKKYYISRGIFVDRTKSIKQFRELLSNNVNIINIYGNRGIGKSAFLRFLCDNINNNLNYQNKQNRIPFKKLKGFALYIELSIYGERTIEDQILNMYGGDSFIELIEEILKIAKYKKKIFIFLDNINTKTLSKQIESLLDKLWNISSKFCIILGSIEKQQLLQLQDKIGYIYLEKFGEDDIFEYADKNNYAISTNDINNILDFTKGLPIFISFLIKNQANYFDYNAEKLECYIERVLENLNKEQSKLAYYIAFLSITNSLISLSLLKKFITDISTIDLEYIEKNSLIEYDQENHYIKMHEIFRNYIVKRFRHLNKIISDIYAYYDEQNLEFEKTYYLIMLDNIDNVAMINNTIEKAIASDNYSFLILLGEHYKLLNDWKVNKYLLDAESFLKLLYGYVYALMGIGNYPAAREIINECKIPARSIDNVMQFRFSLLTANLYHLQNEYDISIETYNILLSTENNELLNKYGAKCFWGIAHAIRHEGYNLEHALTYYNESIKKAEETHKESEIIKSMLEKLSIYLLREDIPQSKELMRTIKTRMTKLPNSGYYFTKLSFKTYETRYNRIINKCITHKEFKQLNEVLVEYKKHGKRLIYNIYFEIGELYRSVNDFENAIKYYKKSLLFSNQNYDFNLKTLSIIALSICQIVSTIYSQADITIRLAQVIDDCEKHNLYINKLLAELLLNIIKNNSFDSVLMDELKRVKYLSAINIYDKHNILYINELILILM